MTADIPATFQNTGRTRPGSREAVAVGLLFLAVLAGYANSFYGPFVYDDLNNIVTNPNVHASDLSIRELAKSFSGNEIITRPLSFLSFALNHAIGGLSVFGYHLVNFFVHFLASVVLFFLFRTVLSMLGGRLDGKACGAVTGAFLAALFWAVNPIQTNAVTFIVQRMTSLCALFFFLALWCYILGRTGGRPVLHFVLCGLCCALSLGFKENAILLPFNFALVELIFFKTAWSGRQKIAGAVFLVSFAVVIALIGGYFWDGLARSYADRYFTLYERLLTEPRVLFFYLGLMAAPWPTRFALLHDFTVSRSLFSPWTTLPSIIGVSALVIFAVFAARRRRLLSFAILFYFLNHLLESTVLPLELVYEHRNYIPSAFLFLPLGALMAGLPDRGKVAAGSRFSAKVFSGLFVLVSIFCVHEINRNFSTEEGLWIYHVLKYPGYSLPHSHLAQAYWKRSMSKACAECRASVDADRFNSKSQAAMALSNQGICRLYQYKDPLGAIPLFTRALARIPDHLPTLNGLAVAQLASDQARNAGKTLEMALSILPGNPALTETRALMLVQEKQYPGAVSTALGVLVKNPSASSVRSVLGAAYSRMGNHEKSAAEWELFIKDYPAAAYGTMSLIYEYLKLGKTGGAEKLAGSLSAMIPRGREDEFLSFIKADPVAALYLPASPDFWIEIRRIMDKKPAVG